jgi:DNA-directed RNA polymerase sigma subunit (sigma70/sigma32)
MPKQKKRLIQLPKETSDSLSEMTNKDDRDDYVRALRKAGWTLQSISDSIGVSRERVRQIQMDALKRLRRILENKGLSGENLLGIG